MRIWIGNATSIGMLAPRLLSILDACYRYLTAEPCQQILLLLYCRTEIKCFAAHGVLARVGLAGPWCPDVFCGDSATHGHALTVCRLPVAEVASVCRWRERWRFRPTALPFPSVLPFAATVEYCGGLSPLGGLALSGSIASPDGLVPRTVAASSRTSVTDSAYHRWLRSGWLHRSNPRPGGRIVKDHIVEDVTAAPPLPAAWFTRWWKVVSKGKWLWPQEHINVKEFRVLLQGIRRLTRLAGSHGMKIRGLSDSLVSICCVERGRARSPALNVLCRRLAAYASACQSQLFGRHCISEDNPADIPSREHEPARDTWPSATVTAHRKGNAAIRPLHGTKYGFGSPVLSPHLPGLPNRLKGGQQEGQLLVLSLLAHLSPRNAFRENHAWMVHSLLEASVSAARRSYYALDLLTAVFRLPLQSVDSFVWIGITKIILQPSFNSNGAH